MVEGTQIGRFRIQEELGHGGMGTVYRAEDPVIGRHVAIKIIHLDDTGPPEVQRQLAQSFLREIHTAGVLQHPGIVSIFDAGKQDNLAYIVMELVAGVTFESMLRGEPRPPLAALLAVCRQAASALDYAHAHGVLHRDVKPSNVLVQPNGIAKIVDFGIAKAAAQTSTMMLSQAGTTLGTPDYMSPEQVIGKPLDGRTDQWSLAVVAYMALTGVKPFKGEHFTQVMERIMNQDPQPPYELNPLLSPHVNEVMARALSKDPTQRFGTCSEFLAALETACAEKPRPQAPKPAAGATMTMAMPQTMALPPKSKSRWPLAAAGILLVVGAGAAILALRGHKPQAPAAAPIVEAPVARAPQKNASRPPAGVTAAARPAAAKPAGSENPTGAVAVRRGAEASRHVVRLVTTPPDAEVIVDDNAGSACHSPCTAELPAGPHVVRATKAGFSPMLKNVIVESDQQEVAMVLEQTTAPLRISSNPEGATISVDGVVLASMTPTSVRLPMGSHSINLTKEGFAECSKPVNLEGSLEHSISCTLAPVH